MDRWLGRDAGGPSERTIRGVAGAWFIYDDPRSTLPDPVWLGVEGLGQVRCGCSGNGTASPGISDPAGLGTAEGGRVEVSPWTDAPLTPFVRATVERVVALVYEPHGTEVGFLMETSQGAVCFANLGDELEVGPWPDSRWDYEAVTTRS